MKFVIPQKDFARLLTTSSKSFPIRPNLPVLAQVLLVAKKDKLEVLATDLETAIKCEVKCEVVNEGQITVPGRMFLDFVSQLPEGEMVFEKLGEEAVVAMQGFNARFATMAAEEFPAIPKIDSGISLKLAAGEFAKAATSVVFAAAQDEARPILSGILIESNKKNLSMVATDGYRLSFIETTQENNVTLKILVPAKTIGELIKIIGEAEGDAEQTLTILIAKDLNQVNFKIRDVEYTSRLIEGEFPNWQKIIPTSFTTKATIVKEELMKRIRVASIFAKDAGNIIKFRIEGKKLSILASTGQVASNEIEMDIDVDGKGGEIAFNYRYLLEALSVTEDEEIFFEMIESLTPGKISGVKSKNSFNIIMPVRLQG